MNLAGTQLGHYRITRFLKSGGMGEVYLSNWISSQSLLAARGSNYGFWLATFARGRRRQ